VDAARIDICAHSHGVVVAVAGEVDLAAHDELIKAIQRAVSRANGQGVIVDLAETSFLDSGGIRALVDGQNFAREAGVAMKVSGATGLVHNVLTITGVLESLAGEH
jgi:anti-anti-sigma factor